MNSFNSAQVSRFATPEPRCVNRPLAISKSFLIVLLLGALFCAGAANENPFTPAADLEGAWRFTANPKLPNVLIIGDSISIGYTRQVREKLAGKANVYRPMNGKGPDNCGDTTIGLKKIDGWVGQQKWDVIHFNWGLWDLCYRNPQSKEQGNRDKVGGKISSTPADYEKNLEQLVTRLEATGAKLIWANITVVPEGEAGRLVGDDEKYNAIAARVMQTHGIATDDLFTLTKGFAGKYSTKAGDVHYTTEGYEKLASQVAATIKKVLPNKTSRQVGAAAPLFTQEGSDPTFAEVLQGGKLPKGENSNVGVTGSAIDVKNELVEVTPEAKRPIPKAIRIHTLGNSVIPREDFKKWSRWYQEDGGTQVFRLFKGETNVRNARANAARIEAFSDVSWKRGAWHEWSGTYTIIKPHGAAIFQAKNNINDWSVQINMNAKGDVILNHRRAEDKVIATDMVGKPFHIRVRDNGQDYEVYLEGQKVGAGFYARPEGTTAFRWGMYVGHSEVDHDAMIFVSGATVDSETASDSWTPPSPAKANK